MAIQDTAYRDTMYLETKPSPAQDVMFSWQREGELRAKQQECGALAYEERRRRRSILEENASDPAVQAAMREIGEGTLTPVLTDRFFGPATAVTAKTQKLVPVSDRYGLSPQLQKLLEEQFPIAGSEERIRNRLKKPMRTLKGGLTKAQARYFAEDVDLEYDV